MTETLPIQDPSIASMFKQWLAIRNRPIATDEEMQAGHLSYLDLQERIIAAEPQTPRDVAIMFIVDTDFTGSDFSEIFEQRIFALAGVTEATKDEWRTA